MRCMSEAETRVQDRSAADLLTADPGAMSPLERSRAVSALLAAYPLVQVMLEGPLLGRAALPLLADAVQPGELRHLSARCYEPFEAEALLVLEREHDVQVVHVEEVAERRGLLGRVTRTTRTTRSIERRVAPASAWEVAEAFVGARAASVATGKPAPLGGALLPLRTPLRVSSGVDVLLSVRHHLAGPAPFAALLIGKLLEGDADR